MTRNPYITPPRDALRKHKKRASKKGFTKKSGARSKLSNRSKFKVGSRTKTASRKQTKTNVQDSLSGITTSKAFNFTGGHRSFLEKMAKLGPTNKWQINGTSNPTCTNGQQIMVAFDSLTQNHVSNIQFAARQQWLNAVDPNVAQVNVAGAVQNTAAVIGNQIFIVQISSEYQIVNASVDHIILELYDYYYRRDSVDLAQTILQADFGPDQNYGATNLTNYVVPQYNTPNIQPTDNSLFCKRCKIKKRIKLLLAPGEMHVHKLFARYNKVFKQEVADVSTQPLINAYAGWTHGVVLRAVAGVVAGTVSGMDVPALDLRMYGTNRITYKPIFSGMRNHVDVIANASGIGGQPIFVDEAVGQVFQTLAGLTTGFGA